MTPSKTTATPRTGRRMDLRLIAVAGAAREAALKAASAELDRVVDELIAAGPNANIALAAKLAGVSRDTLYARLRARRSDAA